VTPQGRVTLEDSQAECYLLVDWDASKVSLNGESPRQLFNLEQILLTYKICITLGRRVCFTIRIHREMNEFRHSPK
jgi:hypothetical protein